ncbi:MAG: hypothetical protein NTY10_05410, partial [Candidatus Omnitrophica bacterium]|nr:hypothetical protein [Candidatus Omnitrophota bacterium]
QSYPRTQKADADKAALKKMSAELRGQLEPYYDRPFDSSNDDVVVRLRKYGTTDYVFAVNDNRKFGKYVGQYGLVMEEGVPSQAVVSVRREKGYIYDLVAGKEVAGAGDKNWLRINKDFGAAEGSLWMVTEKQIKEVKIDLPAKAKRGGSFKIGITVADSQGKAIDAVVPVNVEITNASGAIMEYSGYYGAKDGVLNIKYDASLKDEPGTWRIKVKELASGKTGEGRISLQ